MLPPDRKTSELILTSHLQNLLIFSISDMQDLLGVMVSLVLIHDPCQLIFPLSITHHLEQTQEPEGKSCGWLEV